MTKEQAYEKLELPVDTDLQVARQKFQQMHNDFQVQIDGAFNEAMRKRKEQQLEELKEAYAILNESYGMDDSASLPRTEKTFEQTGAETKKQTTQQQSAANEQQQTPPPPPQEKKEQPQQTPPVYAAPPAKQKSKAGLFIGIAAAIIVVLAGFYFLSNRGQNPISTTTSPRQDSTLWKTTLLSNSEAAYQLYLDEYPDGIFAQTARDSIAQIKMFARNVQPEPQKTKDKGNETAQQLTATQRRVQKLEQEAARKNKMESNPTTVGLNELVKKAQMLYDNKNYIEAANLYRQAANQGDAGAQFWIGWMYDNGLGVSKDENHAHSWYLKSANQGYAEAQHNIGWNYRNGVGVVKNENEAIKWYRKAADQGKSSSQFQLSILYRNNKNYDQEVYWCKKAAQQANADAQYQLGYLYYLGRGVPQDYAQALYWYQKAAQQGDKEAQNYIGNMYENGMGVAKDKAEAIKWYKKAAKQGHQRAINNLKNMGITAYN